MHRRVMTGLVCTTFACSVASPPASAVDAGAPEAPSGDAGPPVFGGAWSEAATDVEFGSRTQFALVVYNDNLWLFGGQIGSSELADIWHTADGMRWTAAVAAAPFGAVKGQVCLAPFNGALWLISESQQVWSSADGVSWTQHSSFAPGASGQCIAWNGQLWDFVSCASGRCGVWSSADGTTWTQATGVPQDVAAGVGGVAVLDGILYVTTANGIYSTSDGKTWVPLNLNFFAAPNLVACNGRLWTLESGLVWSTGDGVTWNKVTPHGPATEVLAAWQPADLTGPELWTVDNSANVWVSR